MNRDQLTCIGVTPRKSHCDLQRYVDASELSSRRVDVIARVLEPIGEWARTPPHSTTLDPPARGGDSLDNG